MVYVQAPRNRRAIVASLGGIALIALAATAIFLGLRAAGFITSAHAQTVRDYTLEVQATDIDYGDGNVWHAWTYNGTVPAPTLRVRVGEVLRVRVINKHDLVHSFHTHLTNYDLANDGSQINVISGQGAGAMIPPGEEYTYEFTPTTPGIYYYHCHSADGHHISYHIHQGLYGAIIVEAPDEPPMRQEVVFMGEMGADTEGKPAYFIMNGMGIPGGEATLEAIFKEKGIAGVAEQFNKTLPVFTMKVNEPMKLHVINIGDAIHSMHIHSATHVSVAALGGRPWPANVLPLIPGAADTLVVNFSQPWLMALPLSRRLPCGWGHDRHIRRRGVTGERCSALALQR